MARKIHSTIDARTQARFWAKVRKTKSCWIWTARLNGRGYAYFHLNGKMEIASRVAWMIANGTIPIGMCICHHCDNPKCVKLEHLFLGTQLDNLEDMCKKGRQRGPGPGSRNACLANRLRKAKLRVNQHA